jgi:hypothetical protein
MVAGELKVVASSDLGELGAKDGPPVTFLWATTGVGLHLVPWLAVAVLLVLLRANRRSGAWWLLLPLLCVQALLWCLQSLLAFVGAEALHVFQQVFAALSFGIAAAWLVCPLFGRRMWVVSFVEVLLAAGCMGLLAFAVRADWSAELPENIACSILLGLAVFWSALALSLAGLFCRRRLRPMVFWLWVLGVVVAGWLATGTPFLLIRVVGEGGPAVWGFVGFAVLVALVQFLVLWPFLLLAFIHPFYRGRLESVWGLPQAKDPRG